MSMDAISPSPARWSFALYYRWWLVPLLLGLHFILGLSAASRKSATFDEGVHLAGGLSYWKVRDYRLNPESGNWPQRWVALPIWLGGASFPPPDDANWRDNERYALANEILYGPGCDADWILLQGRAMIGLLSVALGLIVYAWSRQLFGLGGGLISLVLYTFSPTMLANGFLITADLCVSLFFCAAVWACWRLLHRISPVTVVVAGFALGGLLLSKFSGVLIAPMFLLMFVIRLFNPQPLVWELGFRRELRGRLQQSLALCGVMLVEVFIVGALIWAAYGFRYSARNTKEATIVATDELPKKIGPLGHVIQFAAIHRLLPEAYLLGFSYTMATSEMRRGFFNGAFSLHGWTGFFPYCLAVKTPLETFFVLLLAAGGAVYARYRTAAQRMRITVDQGRRCLYQVSPLLVLLAVYWIASLTSHLNIGQRHLLPTYPPMFILAGSAGCWFQSKTLRWVRWLIVGCLAFSAAEAIWIWPDYLAYFNLLAGGPSNGYRHLIDSSLDWGQDLKPLKGWLDAHPASQGNGSTCRTLALHCRDITRSTQLSCLDSTILTARNYPSR